MTALAGLSEEELLARILPLMRSSYDESVELGPGDDAAVVRAGDGRVVATTDAMVRGVDWRDDWSSGADVGRKAVAQNLADVAAMGARGIGLLATLLADPATPVAWVEDFARGFGAAAAEAGVPVIGGDLGGAPEGVVMISVTALGDLQGRASVLRSGARVGDVVAVAGTLGRSAAGLELLSSGRADGAPELVRTHVAPVAPYDQGPAAADFGVNAMMDISDGLIRDAGRMAAASGVRIALDTGLLREDVALIEPILGHAAALECVLTGGEEHSLLGTFAPERGLPHGWRPIGWVREGEGVSVDDVVRRGGGWDHFSG